MNRKSTEIANKWQMNRYRTPNSHPDGMDNAEFFHGLETDILEYSQQQAISFAEWLSDHPLQFEPSSEKGSWIGLDFEVVSSKELYKLWLQTTGQLE